MKTASPIRALVLLLLVVATVYGGSVTYYATPIPTATTEWSGSFTVPKFDTSLGTLTGIVIILNGDLTGTGSVSNRGEASASGTLRLESTLTVTLPSLPALTLAMSSPELYALAAGTSRTDFPFTPASGSASHDPGAANYFLYTGTGDLTFPVTAVGSWALQNTGGDVTATATSNAGAGLSITYDYWNESETPEPTTFILIGVPLIALGLIARKKLRHS